MAKLKTNTPEISAAVSEERGRIIAIVNSPEGRSRRDAALHLTLNSDLEMKSAIELLAKMPEETSSKFLSAMEREAVNFTGSIGSSNVSGDPKTARLSEIKGSMKHFNHDKGYSRSARD